MFVEVPNYAGGIGGGLLIGLAATLLLFGSGKITGISGILHSIVAARSTHAFLGWRLSYTLGMVISGIALRLFLPDALGAQNTLHPAVAMSSGLLIGFGTRLGSGCTSGHGVCGLPRFSLRSLVAVCIFMFTGFITAGVTRIPAVYDALHVAEPFSFTGAANEQVETAAAWAPTAVVILLAYFIFLQNNWLRSITGHPLMERQHGSNNHHTEEKTDVLAHVVSIISAFPFGIALGLSGMTNPNVVQAFLDPFGVRGWNPTLMFVMGGAVAFNVVSFYLLRKLNKPLVAENRPFKDLIAVGRVPANLKLDWRLLLGSAIFGVGWGLGGYCPGPAVVSLAAGMSTAGIIVPAMLFGMAVYEIALGTGVFHDHHHTYIGHLAAIRPIEITSVSNEENDTPTPDAYDGESSAADALSEKNMHPIM